VNTATILDLITAREAAASVACDDLREQMTKLAGELAAIEFPRFDGAPSNPVRDRSLWGTCG
jgi:hypothetical protein